MIDNFLFLVIIAFVGGSAAIVVWMKVTGRWGSKNGEGVARDKMGGDQDGGADIDWIPVGNLPKGKLHFLFHLYPPRSNIYHSIGIFFRQANAQEEGREQGCWHPQDY
jgi:hypothetical protein